MFHAPYKWTYRPFANIGHAWWDLKRGTANIFRWIPIVWFDRDFDSHFLLKIMERKFSRMAVAIGRDGHLAGSDRHGRQLRVCAALCRRMLADDYAANAGLKVGNMTVADDGRVEFDGTPQQRELNRRAFKHGSAMHDQDQRYLGLLIGKYLSHWWD